MTAEKALTWRRYEDGENKWDDFQDAIFQAGWSHKCPTYVHRTPPCQGSCPSGHDIRGWLAIARGQDKSPVEGQSWQEYAFDRMAEANPFPSVMGRVCPAPCQDGCNRNEVDDFVGINALEQYVGDWAIENKLKLKGPEKESGKKVAVIGGGPGGLSAAFYLRKKGHAVTVFERHSKLGGMMAYGIPGYRVPRDVLDAEIQRILDLGVVAKTNTKIGTDISVEQLEKDFDAIFWAVGAQKGRPLPAPGFEGTPNCITGVDFLDAFNEGKLQYTAKKVIVVGGGDTSIDVASVARRLGHVSTKYEQARTEEVVLGHTAHDVGSALQREGVESTLTSLFPVDKMIATERERDDALHEGVEIKGGVMPLEVLKDENGRARGLKMCECTMNGMTPVPTEGTEFEIEGDLIVSAIGQMGDLADGLEKLDSGNGFMAITPVYQVKGEGNEKHFAGGDIIRPHLLTTAIGHGSIAAESIDHMLAGHPDDQRPKVDVHHFNLLGELQQRHLEPAPYSKEPVRGTSEENFAIHNYEDRSSKQIIPHDELFLGHFQYDERGERVEKHISPDEVVGNFETRLQGFTEEQAVHEGERCMSCGMCFECDNCVIYCPQDAVYRVKKDQVAIGRYVATDYKKCIGCHVCSDVCPTGYIQMGLGE